MIIAGDWAPGNNRVKFLPGDSLVLANLEGPVLHRTHTHNAVIKAGPLIFSSSLPEGNGKFVFSLANNHIMDYSKFGLEATIGLLGQSNFMACGAGSTIVEARQPVIIENNKAHIGIVACCEAQFGVARRNQAGVAEFGPWAYRVIRDLCQTVDAVIVSVHAAVEDSPWPSPYIRELYRSFIDAGASVVHGHHSHVPQGYEAYGKGVIFYGMGNLAVAPDNWRDYPNGLWSLAAEIDFSSKPLRWRPFTLEIRHQSGSDAIAIEESSTEEQENHTRYLEICNRPFVDDALFDALWQEAALRAYYHYGAEYLGFSSPSVAGHRNQLKSAVRNIRNVFRRNNSSTEAERYNLMVRYNMISCESHRQILATALGVMAGEIKDARTKESKVLADEMLPWSRGVVQA